LIGQAAFGVSSDNQLVLTERAHQAALEVIHFVKAQQQAAEAEQLAAQAASADPVPSPKASPKNAPPTSPLATPAKQPQPSPKAAKPSPKPQSSPAPSAAGVPSTPTATDTPEQLAAVLEFVQWSALRLVISALYQHHTTLVDWVHELGEPAAAPEVKESSVPAGAAELSSALGGADVVKAARGEVNSFGEAVLDARAFESILSESIRINCGSAADQLPVGTPLALVFHCYFQRLLIYLVLCCGNSVCIAEVKYKLLTSAALEILKALGLPPTGIIPMSDLAAADKQVLCIYLRCHRRVRLMFWGFLELVRPSLFAWRRIL
jgi:outer membrane biosynthesis protein TonB